jgi:hypothetical protein
MSRGSFREQFSSAQNILDGDLEHSAKAIAVLLGDIGAKAHPAQAGAFGANKRSQDVLPLLRARWLASAGILHFRNVTAHVIRARSHGFFL